MEAQASFLWGLIHSSWKSYLLFWKSITGPELNILVLEWRQNCWFWRTTHLASTVHIIPSELILLLLFFLWGFISWLAWPKDSTLLNHKSNFLIFDQQTKHQSFQIKSMVSVSQNAGQSDWMAGLRDIYWFWERSCCSAKCFFLHQDC